MAQSFDREPVLSRGVLSLIESENKQNFILCLFVSSEIKHLLFLSGGTKLVAWLVLICALAVETRNLHSSRHLARAGDGRSVPCAPSFFNRGGKESKLLLLFSPFSVFLTHRDARSGHRGW